MDTEDILDAIQSYLDAKREYDATIRKMRESGAPPDHGYSTFHEREDVRAAAAVFGGYLSDYIDARVRAALAAAQQEQPHAS